MGGSGSGKQKGDGTGTGKCGNCNYITRRGARGHWHYYCRLMNRRTDRHPCPLETGIIPPKPEKQPSKRYDLSEPKEYVWVKVDNPRPRVKIDWIKVEK